MKFHFKIQDYQTEAVKSVIDVFKLQPKNDQNDYIRDLGKKKKKKPVPQQLKIDQIQNPMPVEDVEEETNIGYNNAPIEDYIDILSNIRKIQAENNIKLSDSLITGFGACSLDIEMETGTGKTYVYIKTIFELNQKYGWSKFIIVVPSVAIREGVKKSFEMTEEHFMKDYYKKARYFIYNSKNLSELDTFSSSSAINVMIINMQAFNSKGADAKRIYEVIDDFGSRKPIDVIKANRPIIILDEPQKMGGTATQDALKRFNPLFMLNYSATHEKKNNLVYVLDALDAYKKRLVKKIEVKGFEVKNLRGTTSYLFLESIIICPNKPPKARIELEIKHKSGMKRETKTLEVNDNLYYESKEMEQYKDGFSISEINPNNGTVTFTNGLVISKGEIYGDVSESDIRRIQIRETILSHFEKEETLFNMGIKTLSLFFIDEVAKYRKYDDNGDEINSEYGEIFEEEYISILNDYITVENTPYMQYLKNIELKETHKGYFSIDKKTKRITNSETKRNSDESDDTSAYDLILKDKEKLLSFEEPTRFIFSHSALREGWDNPNVFQICTLKHSDSKTGKRQEVGRGLRICVDKNGTRMDQEELGKEIHKINKLTVIASESYTTFVTNLQNDIKKVLYDRPTKATPSYFEGKTIKTEDGHTVINEKQSKLINYYLKQNSYVDYDDNILQKYRDNLESGTLAPLPDELIPLTDGIQILIQSLFDESVLDNMFDDGNTTKVTENPLNDNFYKKEFQALWENINHKYAYNTNFESSDLVREAIDHINKKMYVTELQYTKAVSEQKDEIDENMINNATSFKDAKTKTETLKHAKRSQVSYDLVGKIAHGTKLTRRTVVDILTGINPDKFNMFKNNPEEYIDKAIKLIEDKKADLIAEEIFYVQIDGNYDKDIFTSSSKNADYSSAFSAKRHIQDYVVTDGINAENSIERKFVKSLEGAEEVCVYAKLPRTFKIPTPVGYYSPDWAIAFNEGAVKHIYFVAETKGSTDDKDLKGVEIAKIECAKKLYNEMSTSKVKYHEVTSYQNLLDIINTL